MSKTISRRAMLLVALLSPAWVGAATLEMVIFGDSLSDSGNIFGLSGGGIPPSPPYTGAFSNGPVWVDHLAGDFGLTANNAWVTGTLTGGVDNFAVGGAYSGSFPFPVPTSGNANDLLFGVPLFPGLQEEVATYGALSGGVASLGALHVIWAGANDLVFADIFGLTAPLVAPGAVANIRTAIGALDGFGAHEFLVVNLPDIGATPFGIFSGRGAELSLGVDSYNSELELMIAEAEATLGVSISLFDIHTAFDLILADPVGAGFPGGFGPCLGPAPGLQEFCAPFGLDPNDFVFWDALHPSSRLHRLTADGVRAFVPEPATVLLVVFGLAALGGSRIRVRTG